MTKQPPRSTRGSAYVEFVIIIIPFLILILGVMQTALMFVGGMVVQRAANAAARAAIVVLDDDPQYYGGEGRNQISYSGGSGGGGDAIGAMLSWMGGSPSGPSGSGSARLRAIRSAASMPLLALSPPMSSVVGSQSVYQAIGGGANESNLVGAAVYNKGAVAVTFPTSPGASSDKTSFGMRENVTTRVTYLFHCGVPFVRYFMCESIASLQSGSSIDAAQQLANAPPDERAAAQERLQSRNARIGRWRKGMEELDHAEAPWLSSLTAMTGARFIVIRAEATLPNHGAPYKYED